MNLRRSWTTWSDLTASTQFHKRIDGTLSSSATSLDKISSTVFKTPSKRILLPTSDSPNRGKFPQKGMLSNLTSLGTNKLNIHPLCEVFVNKKSHIFILNDNKIVYHYFFEKIINLIHTGSLGQFCLQNIHSAVLLLKCP